MCARPGSQTQFTGGPLGGAWPLGGAGPHQALRKKNFDKNIPIFSNIFIAS